LCAGDIVPAARNHRPPSKPRANVAGGLRCECRRGICGASPNSGRRGAGVRKMSGTNKILAIDGLTVSFDGFKALNQLTLHIQAGELRCIIGPNGAGKTTMMDVITGKTRPDSGTVSFSSAINLLELSEPEIAQAGIGRKFQKPTVFDRLSVF